MGRDERVATAPTVTAVGRPRERFALPDVGQTVGRYTVLGKLGEGAMGAVFLASDPELDRRIALKLLVSRGAHDFRLLDEARALARLQHPNVVAVHDVGRWEGQVYIAMEHVAGTSLDKWLERHTGWRERIAAFVQAAHGLAAAHRANIVHHDVKPTNIMVGDDTRVRLVDFGIARSTTPDLAHGSVAGTPRYMSPEQRRGDVADARTDQFSLCVALYEALYGAHPFPDEGTEPRVPPAGKVPLATRDAVLKGLAYDPARRHANMEALIAALTPPPRARGIWIAALAVFAVAGGIGAAFAMRDEAPAGKYDAILARSNLPPVQPEPLPDDPMGVTVHRLSNGLTVYISTTRERPRIRATMRFYAGAADAPGVSTLAMLMSRRGSPRLGTIDWEKEKPLLDRIAKLYEQRATAKDTSKIDVEIDALSTDASRYEIGDEHTHLMVDLGAGSNNAWGYRDQSRFEMDFGSNRLETWAEIEAERWTSSVFRMFRAGVAETLQWDRRTTNDFGDRVLDFMHSKLHPYSKFGFGPGVLRREIAREPYHEVVKFFRDYYVPNNAELVLVGDVDPVTAIPILERAFAKWQPRPLPARPVPKAIDLAPETVTIPTGGNREISYHWALPRELEDDPAFLVLDQLLRRINGDKNPSSRITVYHALGIAYPASGSLDAAARELDATIDELRKGTFTDDVLLAAKKRLEVQRYLDARDLAARTMRILGTRQRFTRMVWRDEHRRNAQAANVTREDVVRLANAIFSRPHITVRAEPGQVVNEPLVVPTAPPTNLATGRSKWAQELLDREVVDVQPKFLVQGVDYEQRETPAGLLVTKTDRKSPTFTLTIRYDIGSAELRLACDALAARMGGAAKDWRDGGFQSYTLCTGRVASVTMSGLESDLVQGIATLEASFADPSAAEWTEMVRQARIRLDGMKGRGDWIPATIEQLALLGPSSAMLARFDIEVLDTARYEDGVRDLARLRNSKRSIAYYGARTLDELAGMLPAHPVTPVAPGGTPLVGGKPRVYIVDARAISDNTNVSAVFGFTDMYSPARVRLFELLDQYFSISSHPLPDELRKLSPDVQPMYASSRRDAGYMAFRFKGTPATAAASLDKLLAGVLDAPVDETRLARAREERLERLSSDWITRYDVPLRVAAFLANGETEDPRGDFLATFKKLGKADLEAITAELRGAQRAITIWGNVAGLDRAALAKHGEIVELTVAELLAAYTPKPATPAPVKKRAKPAKRKRR